MTNQPTDQMAEYCTSCSMRVNEHDNQCCFPRCWLNPDNDNDTDNHRSIPIPEGWYDSNLWEYERGSDKYEEIKESL